MFPSTSLTRDDLRRHIERGRTYVWPPNDPNAQTYSSVTSALNSLPKEALPRWAAKVVAETAVEKIELLERMTASDPEEAAKWLKGAPWAQRDKAADVGTTIHEIVELDALGDTKGADALLNKLDPAGRNKAIQARDFFSRQVVAIDHVEFVVYDTVHGFAGTGDFIVTLKDDLLLPGVMKPNPTAILDLKTGKGIWPEVALQIAAYRHANSMVDLIDAVMVPMPETDGGLVLHVTEKSWSLIPVDTSEEAFNKFLAALTLSKHLPLDKMMVGTPIMRGRG
jgi:hypothetical protein